MSIPGSGNQDQNWASRARTAVMALAKSGRKFTSYDVSLAGVEDPDHPARWGALFAGLRAEGVIIRVGDTISKRPCRVGGRCSVWRGVRRKGEQSRLDAEPDAPVQLDLFAEVN